MQRRVYKNVAVEPANQITAAIPQVRGETLSSNAREVAMPGLELIDLAGAAKENNLTIVACGAMTKLVCVNEARRFMFDCLCAANTSTKNANSMADLLIAADRSGFYSHGMNRLDKYVSDLLKKSADGNADPQIIKETPATAWVDGCNGLGAVVGNFCMDLAIEKAKKIGVGWVVAKNSNHYGIGGWYVQRAVDQGLLGFTATNGSPLMAPTNSKEAALGTNPIAFAAPGCGERFLLDIAMTAVSMGRLEMRVRKNEPIPNGWAQGPDGKITNDSKLALKTGCLMPLGGAEETSGYKGYGLGAMVDVLTGVTGGANYCTKIRKWSQGGLKENANLGHLFVAISPNFFAPDFEERLSDLTCRLRNLERMDPCKPVMVPGEMESNHMKIVDEAGGFEYLESQLKSCAALAKLLKVKPLSVL